MDINDLKAEYKISKFYIQRAKRLLPLSYLVAILVVGMHILTTKEDNFHYLTSLLFILFYIPNFYSGDWFFGYSDLPKPLDHYWSLGVEEQFYFAWPLILFLILKKSVNGQIRILTILIGIFMVAHWIPPFFGIGGQSLPTTYADLLLMGALISLLRRYFKFNLKLSNLNATLCLIILFFVLLRFPTEAVFFQGKYPRPLYYLYQLSLVGGVFLLSLRIGLKHQILRFIGNISYGIYLIHKPLLYFAQKYLVNTQGVIVATVVLSIGLAWISYRYFESRFYKRSY